MTEDERNKRMEEVRQEWESALNDVTFEQITYGSKQNRTWRCKTCGWVWLASPDNRIRGGTGCPKCAGKILTFENSFAGVRPDLVQWWDTNKNGDIGPADVFANTHDKYHFVCPHGHSYPRPVYHMTHTGGCKYCSGQAATAENNLRVTHPGLVGQWHPTKNGKKTPEDYLSGSNKSVWWKCSRGHEWTAPIEKRALRGDKCSKCHSTVSLLQLRVYAELSLIYATVQLGARVDGFEVDIYLPDHHFGVEVDGYPWHTHRVDADRRKSNALSCQGIRLVRLRDTRLPQLDDSTVPFHSEINKAIIVKLLEVIGVNPDRVREYAAENEFQNDTLFWQEAANRSLRDKTKSLAYVYPWIAREWDYETNSPALPTQFEAFSNVEANWVCLTCGKNYRSRISHRTYMGSGCPYCSGVKVTADISFGGLHPDALKHWDWNANREAEIDPYALTPRSNVSCHWKCEHGHVYRTSPNKKVDGLILWGKYSGCLQCYYERGQ